MRVRSIANDDTKGVCGTVKETGLPLLYTVPGHENCTATSVVMDDDLSGLPLLFWDDELEACND